MSAMSARSVEILQQLKAEVWWPPDRLGAAGAAYDRDDDNPDRNDNRHARMLGELQVLNPRGRTVVQLVRQYRKPWVLENTRTKDLLLEAMLR